MILPELEFQARESETVLLFAGRMVGIVMPSGNASKPWMASVADGRETTLHVYESSALDWLLGSYLVARSTSNLPTKIEGTK